LRTVQPDGEKRLSKSWVEKDRVGFGVAPSTGALTGDKRAASRSRFQSWWRCAGASF
jgi:hypothetical protein